MSRTLSSYLDGTVRPDESVNESLHPEGIDAVLEDLRAGRMVVVMDVAESGTGALMMAAERTTPNSVNFASLHARGALCVALTPERLEKLRIRIEPNSETPGGTTLGDPVGLRPTGRPADLSGASVSALAATVRALGDFRTRPSDLIRPGHVYPMRAEQKRTWAECAGLAESGTMLARMAGFSPFAFVCGILDVNGEEATLPVVARFAWRHGLKVVSTEKIITHHRKRRLHRAEEARIPTRFGEFQARAYVDAADGWVHLALIVGDPEGKGDILAYIHRPCLAGDILHSLRCDCGRVLETAMSQVQKEGEGVIVYVRAEGPRDSPGGRGDFTLVEDEDLEADDYAAGAQILADMGLSRVRTLANAGKEAR